MNIEDGDWEEGKEPKTPLHFCRLNGAWYFDTWWCGKIVEGIMTICFIPIAIIVFPISYGLYLVRTLLNR